MREAHPLVRHLVDTLSDFSNPPTGSTLVDRIVQVGRYDMRDAQKAFRMALDGGYVELGKGLRIYKGNRE